MCVKFGSSGSNILPGINIWLDLAIYSSGDSGQDLMDFLKSPFSANAGGVGLTGQISGVVNGATKTECSTSEDSADQIGAVLNTLASQNPDAGDLSVRVNGPSGSWTISMAAGPEGSNPNLTC